MHLYVLIGCLERVSWKLWLVFKTHYMFSRRQFFWSPRHILLLSRHLFKTYTGLFKIHMFWIVKTLVKIFKIHIFLFSRHLLYFQDASSRRYLCFQYTYWLVLKITSKSFENNFVFWRCRVNFFNVYWKVSWKWYLDRVPGKLSVVSW